MKKNYGLFFGFAVLLLAAIFTFAACGDDDPSSNPNIPAPPPANANETQIKEYFEGIWGDLPADWKEVFLMMMQDYPKGDITDVTELSQVDWTQVKTDWENNRMALMMIINDYINAGKSVEEFWADNQPQNSGESQ